MSKQKHWNLKPQLFLLVGPDAWSVIRFGPISGFDEMQDLLSHTPDDIRRRAFSEADTSAWKRWDEMLCDSVYEWNCTHCDEHDCQESGAGWKWIGITIHNDADATIQFHATFKVKDDTRAHIAVQEDELDSEARTIGLEALNTLKKLKKF